MDQELQTIGMQLAAAALRNTASNVTDRITAAKARKRDQETIAELEQIINELIADKTEITRIAQSYEEVLVAQRLSAADVEYVTSNVIPVISKLAANADADHQVTSPEQFIDVIKPILSVETITILQLLGFNFKIAIGEPLTELLRSLIQARAQFDPSLAAETQRLAAQRELAIIELARDPDAYARFVNLFGGS
ncbi:MAG TPA: hypothetical protein VMB79_11880 [Jatrophihabitans sp.]|nr:hypothetical protein [Jatrophihabitans sp.]